MPGSKIEKTYFVNTSTNKMHIRGFCYHSKLPPDNLAFFDTEDEALAFGGRAIGMCKLCMKERERRMREK